MFARKHSQSLKLKERIFTGTAVSSKIYKAVKVMQGKYSQKGDCVLTYITGNGASSRESGYASKLDVSVSSETEGITGATSSLSTSAAQSIPAYHL